MAKVLIGNFKGPKGDQGVKGDPGTAASIQVGTTQTVQPEENAEVTNTGTTSAAVLNFKIPRGKDGMTDLTAEYKDASEYTCQPTVNAPVVVKELDGKTEQVETTGAQLFDASKIATKTHGGATVTNNGDGSFTISGSGNMTKDLNHRYDYSHEETMKLLKNGNLNIKIEKVIFPYVYIQIRNSQNDILIELNSRYAEEESIEITEEILSNDGAHMLIGFYAGNGLTIVPGTIKPMIYQDGDGTWEPFSGGQPAPSPDYPQVIKGVGGMGYFDGEWVQGNISSTGTVGTETTGITSTNAIPCKQNDNIAVTYEDSIDVIAVAFYNASGAYISTSTSGNSVDTFTATAPANAASFKVNLRVVSGSTITPNGAKYCTVTINGKYQTGVEVTGKNLLNIEEWLESKGAEYTKNGNEYTIATIYAMYAQPLILFDEPQQITLSAEKIENITSTNVRFDLLNGTELVGSLSPTDKQRTVIADSIRLDYGGAGNFKVKGLMLNTGSEPLPWEPYHHTAISIPLTSPLYEGDKLCYVKPGESYVDADGTTVIADRILYGVYRENGKVVLDGSEDEQWKTQSTQHDDKIKSFYIPFSNGAVGYKRKVKCNKFKSVESNFGINNDGTNINVCSPNKSGENLIFDVSNEISTDVGQWKTWLSENKPEVIYELEQPYFEPFVDQSIFYALRTDDTLSYVYSTDPIEPVLTVEVAKNSTGGYLLESYAQAQKNAISEASNASRLSAVETEIVALNSMRQELESVVLVTMN